MYEARAGLGCGPNDDLANVDIRRARDGPEDRVGHIFGADRVHPIVDVGGFLLVAAEANPAEFGLDHAGLNIGESYAAAHRVDPHGFVDRLHGVLGRAVDIAARIDLEASDATERHDVAALTLEHSWSDGAIDVQDTFDIRVDHRAPFLRIAFVQLLDAESESRVVDQEVEPLMGELFAHFLGVAHVEDDDLRITQFGGQSFQAILAPGTQDELAAFGVKGACRGGTDPGGGAGYEGEAIFERFHTLIIAARRGNRLFGIFGLGSTSKSVDEEPGMLAPHILPLLVLLCLPFQEPVEEPSFTLFTNATIYLGDAKGTRTSAMLVSEGKIVEFGAEHEFAERRVASDWEIVNLRGGYVVPGLQDSHCDVVSLGRQLAEIDVSGLVEFEALLERIAEGSVAIAEGEWILARGWDPVELPAADSELVAQLSALYPANPVRILHAEGTAALLNKRALSAAGFDDLRTASVHGGVIERDEEGHATGLVFGRAVNRVEEAQPGGTHEDLEDEILAAQTVLLAAGITAVHDMGVSRDSEEVYRTLVSDGRLQMRVVGYLDGRAGLLPSWLKRGAVAPDAEDRFCIQGVYLVADGSLSLRTASLLRGYDSAPHRKAPWLPSDGELRDRIANSMAAGLQPAVMATGDRACRNVLDVYEEFGFANPESKRLRPRIEGVLLVSPKDWARFPRLGVLPSMQSFEATTNWIEMRVEEDQVRGAFAWRDVAQHIGTFALGSRSPVRSFDPRLGLHAARVLADKAPAVSDVSPEKHKLTNARAAIAGYTMGAAYAAHQEDRRGKLFVGYWADMTVFDTNPIEGAVDDLLNAQVLMTIIDGEIVWAADE